MSKGEDRAEREASAWIARFEAHDVTLRDHQRFRAWLAKSPGNQRAYEAVARTWDSLDALAYLDASLITATARPTPSPSRRALLLGGAGAGAVALVAGFALLPVIEDAGATPYLTRVGQRRSFALADGSTAELNADSALRVAMSHNERHVHLVQGEALFNVAHDPARPFVVKTPFGELRAHGTSFLVKLGSESARVTVLEGAVEGQSDASLFARPSATAAAHEEITLDRAGAVRAALDPQALSHRLAWRQGMLAFDGDTLIDAALEIERQTGVHFEFAEPSIGQLRIGGYISATDVSGFIQLVDENLNLRAERQSPNRVRVTRA